MNRKIKTLLVVGSMVAAMTAGAANNAGAAVATVVAGPGAFQAGYATPVVVAPKAAPLTFVNGDIQSHNVVALDKFLPKKTAKKTAWCKGYGATKCPVFWSKTGPLGGNTAVEGLAKLKAGQYAFFCTIHPGMKGTLVVQ